MKADVDVFANVTQSKDGSKNRVWEGTKAITAPCSPVTVRCLWSFFSPYSLCGDSNFNSRRYAKSLGKVLNQADRLRA